jgi:heat shock protein HslJ
MALGKQMIITLITLALAIVLAACGGPGGTAEPLDESSGTKPTPGTANLDGTEWVLVSLNGRSSLEGPAITLAFPEAGYLQGKAGCNHFGARYASEGNGFYISEGRIDKTDFACDLPENVMQQEVAFFEALASAVTYWVTDDRLGIEDASGGTVLTFIMKEEPSIDPTLDGTEWVLTSLNGGNLLAGSHITLAFAEGQASGYAGCNRYSSEYTAADEGILTIPEVAITARDCLEPEGVMQQEMAYVEALRSAVAYRLMDDRLEIENASGETILKFAKQEFPISLGLDGTEWVLTTLNGSSLVAGSNITLGFAGEVLNGFAGCNAYGGGRDSGKYIATDEGTLTIPQIAVTLQLCQSPEGVMEQETAYLEALRNAAAYRVIDDRLEIDNAAGETTLVFTREEQFPMDPSDLVGTAWRLRSWNGNSSIEGSTLTVAFHNAYRVGGHAGCRGYVATYEASGDDIGFLMLGMTGSFAHCSGALMEQEGQYTTVLGWATDYQLNEGPALRQFKILTARGEVLVFERLPEDAEASLEGTAWTLTAFVEEKKVEGMATPALIPADLLAETEVTATFEDGTVSGSAGCNHYSAAYALEGSFLSVETPAATEMACLNPDGVMEQEGRFLGLLGDVTAYHLHGSQLWLETGDGGILVFDAKAAGFNLTDLIEDLHATGLTVEPTTQWVDHGFAIQGQRILVNDAPVFVYEFSSSAAAETASAGISADKYSMTITRLEDGVTVVVHSDWVETPHLYKKGRLIVITGDHPDVLKALDAVLGPQFAGG